ncbi:MAG: lactonase family protein [Planctomycetota bacterium]|nr:lactonase family protein [Planctomycetota bacterium]MDA1213565.1 lactonase family protein [Planctomycetota bacterium]
MLTFAGERVTPKKLHIYVATYSAVEGEGIFRGEFDTSTGDILNLKPTGGITSPAAIVPHPSGKYFYATSSMDDDRGQSTGAVVAFAVDETTGEFTMIDRQSTGGTGPCFLSCHPQGKLIVIANCGTATVACLPLTNDGRFGNTSTVIQHDGQSRNSEGKPQAHSIQISPNGNFAVAADLGLDRLFVYRLNALNGTMAPHELKSVDLPQGNGPRHVTFHPSGRFIYVIGELGNTVSTLRTDVDTGETVLLQNITTLSQNFSGDSYAADIVIMQDGDFLYGTNRGEDSVAIWRVNGASGLLTTAGNTSCGGKFPRSAAIDPSGRFLIIGNQKSDQLQVFRIESKDGSIMPHGAPIPVPTPVCIKF